MARHKSESNTELTLSDFLASEPKVVVLWRTRPRPTVPSSVTGTLSHRCARYITHVCPVYHTGVTAIPQV